MLRGHQPPRMGDVARKQPARRNACGPSRGCRVHIAPAQHLDVGRRHPDSGAEIPRNGVRSSRAPLSAAISVTGVSDPRLRVVRRGCYRYLQPSSPSGGKDGTRRRRCSPRLSSRRHLTVAWGAGRSSGRRPAWSKGTDGRAAPPLTPGRCRAAGSPSPVSQRRHRRTGWWPSGDVPDRAHPTRRALRGLAQPTRIGTRDDPEASDGTPWFVGISASAASRPRALRRVMRGWPVAVGGRCRRRAPGRRRRGEAARIA